MKKTYTLVSLLFTLSLIVGAFIFTKEKGDVEGVSNSSYVTMEDGIQIINVTSNNQGYTPNSIEAKAGIESTLRLKSQNSYGCERAFRIPSMGINKILPTEGTTDIPLGKPEKRDVIFGSCSMGMYTLKISFE